MIYYAAKARFKEQKLFKRQEPVAQESQFIDNKNFEGMTKEKIIENVYMKPDANVYIASFMPTLIKNKNLEYSQKLIKKGLREFIDVHVKCFRNYKEAQVSFVGSVASLLQDNPKSRSAATYYHNVAQVSVIMRIIAVVVDAVTIVDYH